MITASVNPVLVGSSGTGTTKISWFNGGEIYVSVDGESDSLFAIAAAPASQDAPWIQSGHTYTFTAYHIGTNKIAPLGEVRVVGISDNNSPTPTSIPSPTPFAQCPDDDDFTEFVRCSNNQAIYRCPGTNVTKAFGEPYASQHSCVTQPTCNTSCARDNGQNCTNPRKADDECADYYQDTSFTCHFLYSGPNRDGCADWRAER